MISLFLSKIIFFSCMSFANRFAFYRKIVFFDLPFFTGKTFFILAASAALKKSFCLKLKSYNFLFDLLFSYSLFNVLFQDSLHQESIKMFLLFLPGSALLSKCFPRNSHEHLHRFSIRRFACFGGPKWARTTDLALIRRAL